MTYFTKCPIQGLVERIDKEDAVCVPNFLTDTARKAIIGELATREWVQQPIQVGSHGVRQDYELIGSFDATNVVHDVCLSLEMWLDDMFQANGLREEHVHFDEMRAQKYRVGSEGVTPHRDFIDARRLIAILPIQGAARFGLCDDRAGTNAREIGNRPGDLILMRGYGFLGSKKRPFHFVDRVTEERISLGFRVTAPAP